jgi:hypothetical protein
VAYTRAIECDPRHFKAYFNRGFAYDKVSDAPVQCGADAPVHVCVTSVCLCACVCIVCVYVCVCV